MSTINSLFEMWLFICNRTKTCSLHWNVNDTGLFVIIFLLFSLGILQKIAPSKRRYTQMATICIDQRNMGLLSL